MIIHFRFKIITTDKISKNPFKIFKKVFIILYQFCLTTSFITSIKSF
jgi:hypothetical protein